MQYSTYPGMEKEEAGQEQRNPNCGQPRWPFRTPANSPLVGRQQKPGASTGQAGPSSALQPSVTRGLFGGPSGPASPSAWGDAAAPEATYTMSTQHPADSGPTIEGPAFKRARVAASHASGLWALPGGAAADSDDSDGEEAVSRKRPTPEKAPGAGPGAAALGLGPMHRLRTVVPQHPPPTWASSMQSGGRGGSSGGAFGLMPVHQQRQQAAGAEQGCEEDEWSCGTDMEEDSWQRECEFFPLPLPLDVEE